MPLPALATVVAPLTWLAVALPFLFAFTRAPISNFWPLLFSWNCAALLVVLALARRPAPAAVWPEASSPWAIVAARPLAVGLLCAALLAGVIGLLQYFLGNPGIAGVQPSTPGQAIGNLRQRNLQASLLSMGLWVTLWLLAQRWLRHGPGVAALALLAIASAATASRTGALQWLLVVLACVLSSARARTRGLALMALVLHGLAAWALPLWLLAWSGVSTQGLFARLLAGQIEACSSRTVLWSNMVHLIAQKPWTGWGWGELDYAHYITPFPGERFCALLDNAHNLPLHLAVELGLPVALLLCAPVAVWVVRSRPWAERQPARQLAWGLLAIVGVHSLLEYPLWYGPFQLVTLLALMLLCRWPLPRRSALSALRWMAALMTLAAVALGVYVGRDFYRVSQLYRPLAERPPSLRNDTVRKVGTTPFFTNQVDFALLTTLEVTPENAGQVFAVASKLLHFSPEPRVIEPLLLSAALLGRDDVVVLHMQRYQAAYPAELARWRKRLVDPGRGRQPAHG